MQTKELHYNKLSVIVAIVGVAVTTIGVVIAFMAWQHPSVSSSKSPELNQVVEPLNIEIHKPDNNSSGSSYQPKSIKNGDDNKKPWLKWGEPWKIIEK